uniref:Uncharacterized protein n=1 Tax=Anopheles arabiensis TaxID=7173 RepID=A0A182ICL1_ANOAR
MWQQLRFRYRQVQMRVDAASRNGENPRYRPKWFAYEAMAFLRSSSTDAMLQRDGQVSYRPAEEAAGLGNPVPSSTPRPVPREEDMGAYDFGPLFEVAAQAMRPKRKKDAPKILQAIIDAIGRFDDA